MTFETFAAITLAGLAGPLLGAGRRIFIPVMIGEVLAGVLVGPSVLGVVDPSDPATRVLANIGFALLMFTVGVHVPLRDRRLAPALRRGAPSALGVLLLAPLGGLAVAWAAGGGHAAIYGLLLASGSVAAVLGMLQEAGLDDEGSLTLVGQVTIADILTVLALPLVLQPARTGDALLGGLLVAVAAAVVYRLARDVHRRPVVRSLRQRSKRRHWALDLRLSLLVLFALAWLAQSRGTSVLVAGFGTGLLVAALPGPKRLFIEIRGVADGFFVPLFFVVLGAGLPVGALIDHPSLLRLTAGLLVATLVLHLAVAAVTRQRPAAALVASAQLGVPAAVVTIGIQQSVLTPGEGAAIIAAAIGSLLLAALGTSLLVRRSARAGAAIADGRRGELRSDVSSSTG